jgi:hypothetical protein
MSPGDRRSLLVLRVVLAAGILSTLIHYSHNFVAIGDYPGPHGARDDVTRVLIVVSWPVLTAIGLLGLHRYGQGRLREAQVCLAIYSLTGITTLGHFFDGAVEIPTVFYLSIFTDAITGLAALAFAVWLIFSAPHPAEGSRSSLAPTWAGTPSPTHDRR